ncbi:MAG: bis(5'-nucleosyl)-tetraphosphatase (symmetrical) YqeK [Selenomonadaceae bacterium]|nr:bis(5'-nucleosyl)-tetraphosphatase (symmetrical) YqeK [Selenomonadaceae bacterium]
MSMTWEEMKDKLAAGLKPERYQHSLGVADTAVFLARRFGVAEEKAKLAGLLHDAARVFPNEALPSEAKKRHLSIDEVEAAMPLLLHAPLGAILVAEEYGVKDAEIAQAIARHTVGGRSMTPLDKLIYFADMIEPNRNYPGVEELRRYAREATLDEMILKGLSESIIFVTQKGSLIHPDTVAARNEILLGMRAP